VLALAFSGSLQLLTLSVFGVLFQWLIISAFLRGRCFHRSRNVALFYSLLLCLISIISYSQSISIGGALSPYLGGSDGEGYFETALELGGPGKLDGLGLIGSAYFGYQFILSYAFDILGQNLFVGLWLNNTVLILSLLLVVKTTWLLTEDKASTFYSAIAFILTSKFIFYSNVLLKDPFLMLGVALLSYMVAITHKRTASLPISYLLLIFAAFIFGMMRQPMLVLIPISFLVLGRENLKFIVLPSLLSLVLGVSFFSFIGSFTSAEFSGNQVMMTIFENKLLGSAIRDGVSVDGIVGTISVEYEQLPILIRIFLVAVPGALQFFLPFNFWSTSFLDDYFINLFNLNLNVIWYMFVGVFMVYGIVNWRRLPKSVSTRLFVAGVLLYISHAFIFSGVVPRYGSPYLVMMFPTIGFLMSCLVNREGDYIHIRKFFQNYYFLILIMGVFYLSVSFTRYI